MIAMYFLLWAAADPITTSPLTIGSPAPELAAMTFVRGEAVKEIAKGSVHVVEFSGTTCGPCIRAIPEMNALQQQHPEVVFVSVFGQDEKVVRSLHPHWLVVLVPSLIGVLVIAAVWVIVALTPVDPTWDVVDWVIIGVGIILLVVFVLVPFLRWRTTRYLITNKRVVVRRGILAKAGQDIALSKVTDVSFRQSFFDRIIRSALASGRKTQMLPSSCR